MSPQQVETLRENKRNYYLKRKAAAATMDDIQTDTMVTYQTLFDPSNSHPCLPGNSYMQMKFGVYYFLLFWLKAICCLVEGIV
jgi:hypothetical protein